MPQGDSVLIEDPDYANDLKEEFTYYQDRYDRKITQRCKMDEVSGQQAIPEPEAKHTGCNLC